MNKRKYSLLILGMMLTLSLSACGKDSTPGVADIPEPATDTQVSAEADAMEQSEEETSEDTTLANPWENTTEEEAWQECAFLFHAPEGAENVQWRIARSLADPSGLPGPMVEVNFDLNGLSFTARAQNTGDTVSDISGTNYEWTVEDDIKLANWGGGNMTGKAFRFVGDSEYVDLITWYDIEIGVSYALTVSAEDLDGFDLQAIAEAMYDISKQPGANIPEEEAYIPTDITGCDTFTQIVDKLEEGRGYANTTVGDTDILLISQGTYDYDGIAAAIDAELYWYHDGVPEYIDYVMAGGTSYPLTVDGDKLYVCGNHFINVYTIENGQLLLEEGAEEVFDTDGNAEYYHYSDIKDTREDDADELFRVPDDSVLMRLYEDFENAQIIDFVTVEK